MTDDTLRDYLLSEAKRRGTWTLEGNRESWAKLSFVPEEGFVHHGGDTMSGSEDFRRVVDESEAYLLLRKHALDRVETWARRELDGWLLEWARRNAGLL